MAGEVSGIVAALLAGPAWQPVRVPRFNSLAVTPLLMLLAGTFATAAATLLPPSGTILELLGVFSLALGGTLLSVAVALPAAIARPGLVWLLPAWLAASVGTAGWSLIAVPATPIMTAVQIAMLLLPFVALGLAGAWAAAALDLSRAAAASGAGPLATLRLLTRTAWPGILRVLLAVVTAGAVLAWSK